MNKLSTGEAAGISGLMPGNQNVSLGERMKENDEFGNFQIVTSIAAGTAGVVTPAALSSDPSLVFDFEILDVTVRTDTAVTDAIVSASAKAVTRAGTIDVAQSKFYPKSNPTAYASAKCNIVDAGGATAPARTVILWCRKI